VLVSHENEIITENFKTSIKGISDKTMLEIIKIKNPNESIFNLIKLILMVIHNKPDYQKTTKWSDFQFELRNSTVIKNILRDILNREINKDILDDCMKCITNFNDIKTSLSKLNKNLISILEFIRYCVEYNIKRNICRSLHEANLNKNTKLKILKDDQEEKEKIYQDSIYALKEMHNELKLILNNPNPSVFSNNMDGDKSVINSNNSLHQVSFILKYYNLCLIYFDLLRMCINMS